MKKSDRDAAGLSMNSVEKSSKNNGRSSLAAEPVSPDLAVILASLQTMREGDFSVRLPGSWTGLAARSRHIQRDRLPLTSRWRRS